MSTVFIVFLVMFILYFVTTIICLVNTYYLCKKVVPEIDEIIYGQRFMSDSWFTLIMRMNEYMAWSTFYEYLPKLAEKRGWTENAAKIPPRFRRRLIINSLILYVLGLILIAIGVLEYFYPELGVKHRLPF